MKLSFILATHNRGPVLLDCLHKTIAAATATLPNSHFEILIVDNASSDQTPALIRQHFPNITLIPLQKNLGPVAKNFAIARATGDFLFLLDDDAFPHPGTIPQALRHFADDPSLAAAVCDVTLPDGSKESSAYPDVFIGAGTLLRRSALESIHALPHPFPAHFFMQAEEYDLSFRLLNAGFSIKRFADLPLTHLKTPNARMPARTTRLDVRNNLFLLAKYIPDPLCHQLAADWLDRYFRMAQQRDATLTHSHPSATRLRVANASLPSEPLDHPPQSPITHKKSFLAGAAQGLAHWSRERDHNRHLLSPTALERIFKSNTIKARLALAAKTHHASRILFADYSKNLLPFHQAAKDLRLNLLAIADDRLANPENPHDNYRSTPLLPWHALRTTHAHLLKSAHAIIIANLNPIQSANRTAELKRLHQLPILNLFAQPTLCPLATPVT